MSIKCILRIGHKKNYFKIILWYTMLSIKDKSKYLCIWGMDVGVLHTELMFMEYLILQEDIKHLKHFSELISS